MSTPASSRDRRPAHGAIGASAALITALGDTPGRVVVRLAGEGAPEGPLCARIAVAGPYTASIGDRVVVAGDAELFVIGVLVSAAAPSIPVPGGGAVTVDGEGVSIIDPAGRVVVRYRDGQAEIAAPAGDLVLSAPAGRVSVRAAGDVSIEAEGSLVQRAAGSIDVEGREIRQRADHMETTVGRLFERTRETFRETAGLLQTRAGRARTLVRELFSVTSGRTSMASTEETSIDGSRVLLG
jgi:Protein of unknown function (DUF3540)